MQYTLKLFPRVLFYIQATEKKKTNAEINLKIIIAVNFCLHLNFLVLINIRKRPTHTTGQSIGILCSLITWCDHGREAAFSL